MAGQNSNAYSSPLKKLVTFFHSSRDRWKAKHQEAKKKVKGCRTKPAPSNAAARLGAHARSRPNGR